MLNADYQGRGYAFEAARAFFDYLFRKKNARRIYAYVEDDNRSSQLLCEKLGMRREACFRNLSPLSTTLTEHPAMKTHISTPF